ncbi:hypothetical protein ACFQH6_18050 [Halobacteriaceae archaeon GCM10025711]
MTQDSSRRGRKPRVSDEDILAVFSDAETPFLTTAEVAEELPIKRRATYNRLSALADADVLRKKNVGGRNSVWWLTSDEVTE